MDRVAFRTIGTGSEFADWLILHVAMAAEGGIEAVGNNAPDDYIGLLRAHHVEIKINGLPVSWDKVIADFRKTWEYREDEITKKARELLSGKVLSVIEKLYGLERDIESLSNDELFKSVNP